MVRALSICALQHCMRKIGPNNVCWTAARQPESKITGATAKIEHSRIAPLQNWAETPRRPRAPHAIQLEGQQMIQEIVARRDFREHFANFARSVCFGLRAFRASSLRGRGSFSHWPCRNRRRTAERSARRARQPTTERRRTMPLCRYAASAQIAAFRHASSYPNAWRQSDYLPERAAMAEADPSSARE